VPGPADTRDAAQGGGSELPESFAVLGFAFYLQPCLLPLMAEMPPGAAGVRLMTSATRTVVLGVATLVGARAQLRARPARFGVPSSPAILPLAQHLPTAVCASEGADMHRQPRGMYVSRIKARMRLLGAASHAQALDCQQSWGVAVL